MKNLIIAILTITNLSGCASMFSGTTQNFVIRSDVPGTKIYMDNEEIGTNSAAVSVSKKRLSSVSFLAKKEGCHDAVTNVNTKFDATSLLGVLLDFGIISILVVDTGVTGAVREAERTNYVLNPTCGATASNTK